MDLRTKKGFTIVEILVTFGIMAMLSGVMLVYSRSSEGLIALFRDQAKAVSMFSRAKSFSLQTYLEKTNRGGICGYGVHIDVEKNSLIFFRDLKDNCAESDNIYTPDTLSSEALETVVLSEAVRIKSSDAADVLFLPPDPTVIITKSPGQFSEELNLILETVSGNMSAAVKINRAGQVTARTVQ